MTNISIFVAFIAGFLSFFSPCVLPLVPSYILYVSGISLKDISEGGDKRSETKAIIINSLLFIFGFSLIFILFGAAASLVGRVLYAYKDVIRIVGGALIIFFGFYIIGVFLSHPKSLMYKSLMSVSPNLSIASRSSPSPQASTGCLTPMGSVTSGLNIPLPPSSIHWLFQKTSTSILGSVYGK